MNARGCISLVFVSGITPQLVSISTGMKVIRQAKGSPMKMDPENCFISSTLPFCHVFFSFFYSKENERWPSDLFLQQVIGQPN